MNATETILTDLVHDAAIPLAGAAQDHDTLLDLIGDARFVLIGEATHGTHEFYRERAQITKRLIREKGFTTVAVEADWPDAYRVNRFVRGQGADADAVDALAGFERFPAWMWRNAARPIWRTARCATLAKTALRSSLKPCAMTRQTP